MTVSPHASLADRKRCQSWQPSGLLLFVKLLALRGRSDFDPSMTTLSRNLLNSCKNRNGTEFDDVMIGDRIIEAMAKDKVPLGSLLVFTRPRLSIEGQEKWLEIQLFGGRQEWGGKVPDSLILEGAVRAILGSTNEDDIAKLKSIMTGHSNLCIRLPVNKNGSIAELSNHEQYWVEVDFANPMVGKPLTKGAAS